MFVLLGRIRSPNMGDVMRLRKLAEDNRAIRGMLSSADLFLVTTVTSLREHDNLYFVQFPTVYLFMFGRLDRYWSQIEEICRTDRLVSISSIVVT